MSDDTIGATASGGACRVLVVDDNVDSAQSMSLLLGLEGYEVECAYDGEEALLRAGRLRPDVVLLDLGLPRLSGYEVARRLRGEPSGSSLLLVAVSGYGRERDRQAAREAGFDLHLTKPADPDEVLHVLSQRRALRGSDASAGFTATARPDPSAGASGGSGQPDRDASVVPGSSPAAGRASPSAGPASGAARDA